MNRADTKGTTTDDKSYYNSAKKDFLEALRPHLHRIKRGGETVQLNSGGTNVPTLTHSFNVTATRISDPEGPLIIHASYDSSRHSPSPVQLGEGLFADFMALESVTHRFVGTAQVTPDLDNIRGVHFASEISGSRMFGENDTSTKNPLDPLRPTPVLFDRQRGNVLTIMKSML